MSQNYHFLCVQNSQWKKLGQPILKTMQTKVLSEKMAKRVSLNLHSTGKLKLAVISA